MICQFYELMLIIQLFLASQGNLLFGSFRLHYGMGTVTWVFGLENSPIFRKWLDCPSLSSSCLQ